MSLSDGSEDAPQKNEQSWEHFEVGRPIMILLEIWNE